MSDAAITPPALRPPPPLSELFTGFMIVGLMGFGGVLPIARRMVIEERRWMNAADFTDLLALCQFLPGGNIVNFAAAVGMRFHGAAGVVSAVGGLMAAPVGVVIVLGLVSAHFQDSPLVHRLFAGLAAAAAGLIAAMAIKLAAPMRGNAAALGIIALCFVATGVLRLPLLPTLLVLTPLSILVTWRFPHGS